jgi:hypothetical protein
MGPLVIAFGTLCSLLASAAFAQAKPSVGLVIERVGRYAETCGIQESSIESIAALTLRNNGIQVRKGSDPFLYIAVNAQSVEVGNRTLGCALNVSVRVESFLLQNTPVSGFKARLLPSVMMCHSAILITASLLNAAGMASDAIEQQIKLCLGQLEY